MSDDYIPVLDAANALKMSPGRFAALLRKEREKLPVEINYELVNQLEDYHTQQGCSFKINIDKLKTIYDEDFAMLGFFPVLMIHRLDWNAFLSGRKEEQEFIAPSHYELEKAQARIADLETELAACQKQLEEARRDISGKEDAELPYTLWREVLAMRKEGMTDKQIAAKLNDKGQGASRSQLGALLYTGKEKLPAAKTLQDNGTELFR